MILLAVLAAVPRGQGLSIEAGRYDQLLDLYVRDGLVYYQAIKSTRGPLDEFVGSLAAARVDAAPRDEQVAFWLNAYNAIVLKTVIDTIRSGTRAELSGEQHPADSRRVRTARIGSPAAA